MGVKQILRKFLMLHPRSLDNYKKRIYFRVKAFTVGCLGFRRGLKNLLMGLLASEDQYLNVANIIKTLNKVT